MRSSFAAATGLAAIALPLAYAQTYSDCNPTNSTQFPCPANTGLCTETFETDFTQGSSANTSWSYISPSVNYGSNGAEFTIAQRGDAPTIKTDFYIFFGKVEVTMKSAPGVGIVSSIVLESDDLDEVDWEFLGGENSIVQTNYFGKGDTTTYDRMIEYDVTTPQDTSHTYTVDWTEEKIEWSVDDTVVRTLNYADASSGTRFPQTPMNVRLGIWAGGDEDNGYWTREWAGGNTTYSAAAGMPWTMYVEKVKITNYNPAATYNYTDTTGDYDSIQLSNSTCSSSGSSTASTATSAVATASTSTAVEVSRDVASSGASSAAGTATAPLPYASTATAPNIFRTIASSDAASGSSTAAEDASSTTAAGSATSAGSVTSVAATVATGSTAAATDAAATSTVVDVPAASGTSTAYSSAQAATDAASAAEGSVTATVSPVTTDSSNASGGSATAADSTETDSPAVTSTLGSDDDSACVASTIIVTETVTLGSASSAVAAVTSTFSTTTPATSAVGSVLTLSVPTGTSLSALIPASDLPSTPIGTPVTTPYTYNATASRTTPVGSVYTGAANQAGAMAGNGVAVMVAAALLAF